MGADHGTPRVSQHRLDGSPPKDPPSTESPPAEGALPAPSAPGSTGSMVPGVDDAALEERRRQWAIERARFEAAHLPPRTEAPEVD
ncbi:MAG TPA: hypothetical protein VMV28_04750 [Thermoplasmata archaeon]|nr:hypothetical protein [Thermoplasmata archaeon]